MMVEHTHVFLGFRANAGDISAPWQIRRDKNSKILVRMYFFQGLTIHQAQCENILGCVFLTLGVTYIFDSDLQIVIRNPLNEQINIIL